ncbi:MAG: hypothetical protein HWN67_11025 [Candidatus Helarchaeota archaeon]|nr:hypothetical protein [Candidatus Helarchaeota archaeon]
MTDAVVEGDDEKAIRLAYKVVEQKIDIKDIVINRPTPNAIYFSIIF